MSVRARQWRTIELTNEFHFAGCEHDRNAPGQPQSRVPPMQLSRVFSMLVYWILLKFGVSISFGEMLREPQPWARLKS